MFFLLCYLVFSLTADSTRAAFFPPWWAKRLGLKGTMRL